MDFGPKNYPMKKAAIEVVGLTKNQIGIEIDAVVLPQIILVLGQEIVRLAFHHG